MDRQDPFGVDRPSIPSVRSIERALDLLLAIEKAERPLGLTELARATGIHKATVQRIAGVLERRCFIQKEQGRYQLGAGIVPLARAFLTGNSLTRAALPLLEQLALVSGETASLFVRQGFDRVVVQRVDSPHPLRYNIRIGQRLPLHVGASGLVLAAAMPEGELQQLLNRLGEIRLATGDILTREMLHQKIERVRQQGFAVSQEEREIGVTSVAAPVVLSGRGTAAAIAVTGPPSRMTPEKVEYLVTEIRHVAQEMAAAYA